MSTAGKDWDRDERDALEGLRDQLEAIQARHRDDPPLELLRAAGADVLPEELQTRVTSHLETDAWSRALVEGLPAGEAPLDEEARRRLFSRIQAGVARERTSGARRWLQPLFMGSAIAAAAAVAWLLVRGPANAPAPPAEPVTTLATAEPPEAAAPFRLPFDKPDVRLSMAALTWRSTSGDNQLLADLRPAFDAYRLGDYASAEREFSALGERYPKTIEILFYQGVTRLYLNDATGARASLAAAEDAADSTFIDDVRWYLAVAEQHAGNRAEARTRLEAICQEKAAHAASACGALEQLAAALPPNP